MKGKLIIMSKDAESEFHNFNINCRFLKLLKLNRTRWTFPQLMYIYISQPRSLPVTNEGITRSSPLKLGIRQKCPILLYCGST